MSLPSVKHKEERSLNHIAIIMDGNRRWAQQRNLPYITGHHEGVKAMQRIVEVAARHGINYLTLFAFSTENWSRPNFWIQDFMQLLVFYLRRETKTLLKNNVVLKIIGDRSKFPEEINTLLDEAERVTSHNTGLTLVVALSYSGRYDITQMAKSVAKDVLEGKLSIEDINEETVQSHLLTHGIPDPDLLIRTSGEYRLSNFLLWQFAYCELYFTQTYWPDFTEEEFVSALDQFNNRERRYGNFSA